MEKKNFFEIKITPEESVTLGNTLEFKLLCEDKNFIDSLTDIKWKVIDEKGTDRGRLSEYRDQRRAEWTCTDDLSTGTYFASVTISDGHEEMNSRKSFYVLKEYESAIYYILPPPNEDGVIKIFEGGEVTVEVTSDIGNARNRLNNKEVVRWKLERGSNKFDDRFENKNARKTRLFAKCLEQGDYNLSCYVHEESSKRAVIRAKVRIEQRDFSSKELRETIGHAKVFADRLIDRLGGSTRSVSLIAEPPEATPIKTLFRLIRDRSRAISFESYSAFMDRVMNCNNQQPNGINESAFRTQWDAITDQGFHVFQGPDAYNLLRECTQFFLMQECGQPIDQPGNPRADEELRSRIKRFEGMSDQEIQDELLRNRQEYLRALEAEAGGINVLPYFRVIRQSLNDIPLKHPDLASNCYGILRSRITRPCFIELIWSYWHEESMLVQAINVISLRFQNRRSGVYRDQLANMDIAPLRPLNNLLFGFISDEQHRLTLMRRNYEYDHHYGIRLSGKAVKKLSPVDSRSRFLEAFHNLLHLCSIYFKDSADTTVRPDGFPLLNALKEVNLLLTEGMHNQFGDLPWTARVEMMVQQWLLARPEVRNFLGGRTMVPYPEEWMRNLDTLNKMQGWAGGVTVRHYRDLADFGEQILLSVRYGNWSNINNENDARLWAEYWRQELQGYIHSYRAVTGVDLTAEPVDYAMPSQHLQRRAAVAQ